MEIRPFAAGEKRMGKVTEMIWSFNGDRLKEARTMRGWTQAMLAYKMTALINSGFVVNSDMVSRWEKYQNRPSIEYIVAMANALDISVDWLLTRTHTRQSHKCAGTDCTMPAPE